MTEERIMTLHPEGKKGVNITKDRYDMIKNYLVDSLEKHGQQTYQTLDQKAKKDLKDRFDGKVGWYVVTVKLDLEARGIIERVPGTTPHEIRLTQN